MEAPSYHFVTQWNVRGSVQEVDRLLRDTEGVAQWWPELYAEVKTIDPGDANGVGKVVDVVTKGFLPYMLRWSFRVTSATPRGFSIEAWRDVTGHGEWTFEQRGTDVLVTYDWNVQGTKPLLRSLSFLLRPLFAANHNYVMRKGEEGLKRELEKLHPEQEVFADSDD